MKKVIYILVPVAVLFSLLMLGTCNEGRLLASQYFEEGSAPVTLYGTLSVHGNEPFTYTVILDNRGEMAVLTGELIPEMNQVNTGEPFVITGLQLKSDPLYADLPIVLVEDYIILD